MHRIHFYKYEGAGNDFVVIDNRRGLVRRDDEALIRQLCDRRFGIGADGLLLLEDCAAYDFEMVYFNADGREGSMCGNGGRCAAPFAHYLGITGDPVRFLAVDGEHEAWVEEGGAWVELRMGSVESVEKGPDYYFLDTGSPHYVVFVDDLAGVDVVRRGRELRYSDRFRDAGNNGNFVQALE